MDTNKVNGMRQNIVKQFSAPGSEIACIALNNSEGVREEQKKKQ